MDKTARTRLRERENMEIPFLMNIPPRRDCGTADRAG
jgi:hypothetical protein